MSEPDSQNDSSRPLILVVDDDPFIRALHQALLARQYDVVTAGSGALALEICRERLPDLVLLDISMPGLDGIEVCRRLREWSTVPVIFVTGHDSIDEHLAAFDAGGDDIVTKPANGVILLRKAALAIQRYCDLVGLAEEKQSLQRLAMDFLSSVGQNGILLNFVRAAVACESQRALAEQLLAATQALGATCSVMLRHAEGVTMLTPHGEPSELERAILEKSSTMGRLFQFKRRLVVNYEHATLLVADMPDEETDPTRAGQLRDDISILAETLEGLIQVIDMRVESQQRAERLQIGLNNAENVADSLRERYRQSLGDVHVMLTQLVEDVEHTYSWLGINQDQEEAISRAMQVSVRGIVDLLAQQGDVDRQFQELILCLRGDRRQSDIELF